MTASLHNPSIGGHSIILFGERVALRPFDEESMRSLRRWYADPEVTRLSRHRQQPVSEDEFDEVIARRVGRAEVLAFAQKQDEINKTIDEMGALQINIKKRQELAKQDIRKLLTPEQRMQFDRRAKEKKHARHPKMQMLKMER